jgi:hypothetical protein
MIGESGDSLAKKLVHPCGRAWVVGGNVVPYVNAIQ